MTWFKAPLVCFFAEDKFVTQHLVFPEDSYRRLVARSEVHYFQRLSKKRYYDPICYPYTPWTLDSCFHWSCSYEEIQEYVLKANQVHEKARKNLIVLHRIIFVVNLILLVGSLTAGIVTGIYGMSIACPFLFVAFGFVLTTGKAIQRDIVSCKARSFRDSLAEYIQRTKGPLSEQGVNVRPGYYGAFIIFEAKVFVTIPAPTLLQLPRLP
mmetsp:Transcript_24107/g.42801  ORF Transcript_24107/g.42801 Transcript_24107/m.42801 type:complete len:210 (+) Transcript_24107:231-860(+)